MLAVLRDVLAGQGIHILHLHLVDLVGLDVLSVHEVHEVDLAGVVAELGRGYGWTISQPPVCMKSPDTPFTSWVNLILRGPGGSTNSEGGVRFCTTRAASFVFVIILEKPSKSFRTVSAWDSLFTVGSAQGHLHFDFLGDAEPVAIRHEEGLRNGIGNHDLRDK